MKRFKGSVLSVPAAVLLIVSAAQAQLVAQRIQNPQPAPEEGRRVVRAEAGLRLPQIGNQWVGAAWWTNTALVQRLGLTEDQKTKIERAYENHRVKIVSTTEQLEKEESQLARFLDTEPLDRNAVLTQIDRVIQARGEMERASSAMTLEMREYLTRAQWSQLPKTSTLSAIRVDGRLLFPGANNVAPVPSWRTRPSPTPVTPEPAPGARRGGRGQQ